MKPNRSSPPESCPEKKRPGKGTDWFDLDNSAKIYPAVRTRDWAAMFRVSVTLTEEIQPAVLQQALEDTVRRIPTFRLALHKGVFWFYLDTNKWMPRVEADVNNPCKKINDLENGGYCFRIRVYRRRIALEVFHSITDGTGAMVFLKTLAARYLTLLGHPIPPGEGALSCDEPPREEELEDMPQPLRLLPPHRVPEGEKSLAIRK